jgi:hypothetical protein
MTIKVTIEVPDTKIGTLLARLNGYKAMCEHVSVEVPKKTKGHNSHSRADSLLTMTGKNAQKGSKIETAMLLFEKLESRNGIGQVTVQAFREHLVKNDQPKGLAQRVVTEKFMTYL